jgi:hypothetical protein
MYLQRSDFIPSLYMCLALGMLCLGTHTGYHLGHLDGSVESDR